MDTYVNRKTSGRLHWKQTLNSGQEAGNACSSIWVAAMQRHGHQLGQFRLTHPLPYPHPGRTRNNFEDRNEKVENTGGVIKEQTVFLLPTVVFQASLRSKWQVFN